MEAIVMVAFTTSSWSENKMYFVHCSENIQCFSSLDSKLNLTHLI